MALVSFVTTTDRQGRLMLAYARGDDNAFTELYEHYRGELYRYFLRRCANRALAEELYQELWMRVIRQRHAYEHKARFSTWLYRIASNLLNDQYRRGDDRLDVLDEDQLPGSEDNDPETCLGHDMALERFSRQLAALPDEQREAFLLKEEGGLSLDEIAVVADCSRETVKSRLRYAVRKLRGALTDAAQASG